MTLTQSYGSKHSHTTGPDALTSSTLPSLHRHIDGAVAAMTPFHNANCPFGFIAATPTTVRVCNLPARVRLDTHWPLRKVRPQGGLGTVQRLAHIKEGELLAVAVARQVGV